MVEPMRNLWGRLDHKKYGFRCFPSLYCSWAFSSLILKGIQRCLTRDGAEAFLGQAISEATSHAFGSRLNGITVARSCMWVAVVPKVSCLAGGCARGSRQGGLVKVVDSAVVKGC